MKYQRPHADEKLSPPLFPLNERKMRLVNQFSNFSDITSFDNGWFLLSWSWKRGSGGALWLDCKQSNHRSIYLDFVKQWSTKICLFVWLGSSHFYQCRHWHGEKSPWKDITPSVGPHHWQPLYQNFKQISAFISKLQGFEPNKRKKTGKDAPFYLLFYFFLLKTF